MSMPKKAMPKTRRRSALKAIGRKKVTFHLDQLIYLSLDEHGYSWFCEMAEAGVRVWGSGVVCAAYDIGFETQEQAEEAALEHLQTMHQAMGGSRRPKGRGRIRRELKIAAWNERRAAERAAGRTSFTTFPLRKDATTDE